MKFTSDPNKQITIMAQSAMRLATDLAIADKIEISKDFKNLRDAAAKIMEIELSLVDMHLENYKNIQNDSRKNDLNKAFALVKSEDDLIKLWSSLSEDEQVQYQSTYNRIIKKVK